MSNIENGQINEIHPAIPMPPRPYIFEGSAYYSRHSSYEPWYNDKANYNTNAKTYYDYLGRFNGFLKDIVDFINRIARRNIIVEDTKTIDFTKINDWIDEGNACHTYHDIITLKADVILSKVIKDFTLDKIGTFKTPNAIVVENDGLWAPDYANALKGMATVINNQGDTITNLENSIQKIIDNLYESGAITTNNIYNYNFNQGTHIAHGKINVFGYVHDVNNAIITHKGEYKGDIISGLNAE